MIYARRTSVFESMDLRKRVVAAVEETAFCNFVHGPFMKGWGLGNAAAMPATSGRTRAAG